jgi:arginyl-tRNA synthetase
MKQKIEALVHHAFESLKSSDLIDHTITPHIVVERTRDNSHGDFTTNVAMMLAKQAKTNPRTLAEHIIAVLPQDASVIKVEIAGPGFINFFVDRNAQYDIIKRILDEGAQFGLSKLGAGKKVQVEFVSANPTGPLHVGHGRGAGRQMDILATSIWLRYLEACGEILPFPSNGYRGDYVRDIAATIHQSASNDYRRPAELVLENTPLDEPDGGDKEVYIDALINRTKTLLGKVLYRDFFQIGLNTILDDIRDDLQEFGVDYQQWFSERHLMEDGSVDTALNRLRSGGHLYEKDGAIWFASGVLGDEKDRVVVRENGQCTYFASDIAYHMNKLDRGFDRIINIWGADHHGYIPRVRAAMTALGADESKLKVLLVQFATLYRGDEKVQMSTRSGDFVTLRQLRNEVGKDAARFFYVMRRSEQHMDFDLDLATSKSNENPVFYVQYAYARVCSVLRQLDEKGWARNLLLGMDHLHSLTEEHETNLIGILARYPEVLQRAALHYEPHQLIQYLRELATAFHTYYNAHQFLVDDAQIRDARLNLICAVKQVLSNGLGLINITAPESM